MWDIIPHVQGLNKEIVMNHCTPARNERGTATASQVVAAPRLGLHSPSMLWLMALVASALTLSACGGGGGGGGGGITPPVAEAPREGALAASKPGELMSYVRDKLAARQAQKLVAPNTIFAPAIGSDVALVGVTAAATTGATGVERSGTTLQEQGVDEDDLLKTDGNLLYTLNQTSIFKGKAAATLQVHRRRADGGVDAAGKIDTIIEAEATAIARGMMLASSAQRVAVLGESQQYVPYECPLGLLCPTFAALPFYPQFSKPAVHVDLMNVANAATPTLAERVRIDGRLVGSRQIGNVLYLVTQHTPQLALEALPANAPQSERDALLAKLTAADVLPTIRVDTASTKGTPQPLLAETDCYVQAKNAALGLDITAITAIDLSTGTSSRKSRCFVGGSEALYMSTGALYLATTRYNYPTSVGGAAVRFPAQMSTDVHKFSLAALTINYRGSGEVVGHLGWDNQRKSYRMSEFNGDLRIVTYTGEQGWAVLSDATTPNAPAPSPATLSILRERASDQTLQLVAKLPNDKRPAAIGKTGEQIYAVRFIGNRAYVVTFRRVDPLYVIDLSDAADPKTVGELQAPGFSDYLFPIGDTLLLGVGRDATAEGRIGGVKVSLFDVANPAAMREVSSRTFGIGGGSASGLDYSRHGIDLFTRGSLTRVAMPLRITDSNGLLTTRGLQKFEVDAAARTLSVRNLVPSSVLGLDWDIGSERSVQIENKLYYFSGTSVGVSDW
jgi:Beta propeller domain